MQLLLHSILDTESHVMPDQHPRVNPANNAIVKATNPRPANPLAPGSLLNQVVAGNALAKAAQVEQPLYTGSGTH